MASDRTRSRAGIPPQFELAGEQVLHAVVIHDEHDQVDRFAADLQAETASLDREESGCAPALWRPATRDTLAVASTEYETAFEQARDYRDTLRRAQHFFRHTLVRCRLDFIKDRRRALDAFHSFVFFFRREYGRKQTEGQCQNRQLSHESSHGRFEVLQF